MAWWPLGIMANRLRAKWTRQRWWAAPWKQRLMAATRPACWSEMTRLHPVEAPGPQPAQELPPEDLVLGVADVDAQDLPVPGGRHPGGDDHRLGGHLVVLSDVEVGGVQIHVGEGHVVEPPLPERVDHLVQLGYRSGTPRSG